MRMARFNQSKLMKSIAVIGTITTVLTIIASALSGLLIFKLIRYLDTAQKALPKIEKASQLYINNNTQQKERIQSK